MSSNRTGIATNGDVLSGRHLPAVLSPKGGINKIISKNVKNNKIMEYTQKQHIVRKPSLITVNGVLRDGQSLEEFLRKAMTGNEPIQATAKMTYNDRKDGVLPQHDIRSDRFELAMMETDKLHASRAAAQHKIDFPTPEELAAQTAAAAQAGQTVGEA